MKPGWGTIGFLTVRPSVHPLDVRPLGFPNFSHSSFEILTWNLVHDFVFSLWYMITVQLLSRLTYFYLSCCPLPKFSFWTFLSRLLWFWLEIWYMNLSWHNTDQVWLLSRLTYFYMSYYPLLEFRFCMKFHDDSCKAKGIMQHKPFPVINELWPWPLTFLPRNQ